jgi:hypothetical protein
MSKRRNREGAPNLPQETLERARRQAAIARGEMPAEPVTPPETILVEEAKPAKAAVSNPYRTVSASQRRAVASAKAGDRRGRGTQLAGARSRQSELDSDMVSELLDNPTVFVTEAELKSQYSFVIADLRNMFVLAGGLMVLLVVLATVLPR